jgi:hypothetical protein
VKQNAIASKDGRHLDRRLGQNNVKADWVGASSGIIQLPNKRAEGRGPADNTRIFRQCRLGVGSDKRRAGV